MKQLNLSEKKEFYNSLLYLYTAGFSYTESLKSIETSSRSQLVRQIAFQVRKKIENGISFSDAISAFAEELGEVYCMLLKTGDMTGKLEASLSNILKDITRIENLKSTLISALAYPVCLVFAAIGVFFFCQFFFFKIFDVMYTEGMCTNAIGQLFLSAIIKIILIYLFIFVLIFLLFVNKKTYQRFLNTVVEKTPLAKLINNYHYYNFFSVLSSAYEAGIPVINAVKLATSTLKTKKSIIGAYKIHSIMQTGATITIAFASACLFSDFAMSQISIGEKAGKLGESFQKIALNYERNLQESINYFSRLIGPFMIVLVGCLVGYIAVNFYSRLYGSMINAF